MVDVVLVDEAHRRGELVRFRTEVGSGLGVWMSEHAQAPGRVVNVEFTVDDSVQWRDLRVTPGPTSLWIVGSRVRVNGLVLGIEDEIVDLRVGPGLLMLEVLGDPPPDVTGRHIKVMVPPMKLYRPGPAGIAGRDASAADQGAGPATRVVVCHLTGKARSSCRHSCTARETSSRLRVRGTA
jgi:head-tail adaptor